jgi:predicted metal-dependent hydrolase
MTTKRFYDEDSGRSISVEIVRDGRLRTRVHWEWNGDQVRIRAPRRATKRELDRIVSEIVDNVMRKRQQVRARADDDLEAMARAINRKYFGGEISWHSLRWVSNMSKRLGSCTVGGPTLGDIRVSDRIQGWPPWVIKYVVAHELCHLKYPNHSKEFWACVNRFPRAERARGFIMGVAFQSGEDADEWL